MYWILTILILMSHFAGCPAFPLRHTAAANATTTTEQAAVATMMALPDPKTTGGMSLTEALAARRSIRSYKQNQPLTLPEISQLLWAAQGITRADGEKRTAPSAGAKYPLELYLVTADGFYHYRPTRHRLDVLGTSDLRGPLEDVSREQEAVGDAPAVFVMAADYGRTAKKYGSRAERYVEMEAGHSCQNLLLQATALGLGGVPIGAFRDEELQDLLGLPYDYEPLYVVPIGRPDYSPSSDAK